MKLQIRKLFIGTLTLAMMAGTLSACSSSKSDSPSAYAETAAAAPAMEPEAMVNRSADMMDAPGSAANSAGGTEEGTATPALSGRKLIRNVDLSVETVTFDTLLSGITGSVTGFGGYVENSDISGNSSISGQENRRYAHLTVRIPSDQLDAFLSQVAEQGNIINKSETTRDVTLQYSDIESRKKSLTIEQDRLWALLEKADTLEAVIALEARLSEIRYELESFESQLRLYDNQVDYSTVSIHISEVKVFTPTSPDSIATRIQKGFSRNLAGVQTAMINFFVWLITSLPMLIPLAVIVILFFAVFRFTIRRKKQQKPSTKSHTETEEEKTP